MPRLVPLLLVPLSVLSCTQQPPPIAPASSLAGQISIDCADEFNIEFQYSDSLDASYRLQLERAAWRWEGIITGDLPAINMGYWKHDEYSHHLKRRIVVDEMVDDLLIVVGQRPLTEFVASSGLVLVRSDSRLPVVSSLALDTRELADNTPEEVYQIFLHEIAHCLGFGLVWDDLGLLDWFGGWSYFTGTNARLMFDALGGDWFTGVIVPVFKDDGHWRASIFGDELMAQGWVFPYRQRLSAITVAQFMDLGYQVNWLAADNYSIPKPESAKTHVEGESIRCDLFRGPVRAVASDGRVVR